MQQILLLPTLAILAGASATIPIVQNQTTRNLLYWVALTPVAVGMVSAFYLTVIR